MDTRGNGSETPLTCYCVCFKVACVLFWLFYTIYVEIFMVNNFCAKFSGSLKHGDKANDLVVFCEIFSCETCNSFEWGNLFTVKISTYTVVPCSAKVIHMLNYNSIHGLFALRGLLPLTLMYSRFFINLGWEMRIVGKPTLGSGHSSSFDFIFSSFHFFCMHFVADMFLRLLRVFHFAWICFFLHQSWIIYNSKILCSVVHKLQKKGNKANSGKMEYPRSLKNMSATQCMQKSGKIKK